MELLLVRHAMAQERDPQRWPDDRKRPLRPEGIRRFRAIARTLGRAAPAPERVWSSRFARAWHTATLLHEEAGWPAPEACTALEGDDVAAEVLRQIGRARGVERLAVVGHAPGLDALAAAAVHGTEAATFFQLRKGGVACLEFEGKVRAGAAELVWLATPRFLEALPRPKKHAK